MKRALYYPNMTGLTLTCTKVFLLSSSTPQRCHLPLYVPHNGLIKCPLNPVKYGFEKLIDWFDVAAQADAGDPKHVGPSSALAAISSCYPMSEGLRLVRSTLVGFL
jgi:hypothetical protein